KSSTSTPLSLINPAGPLSAQALWRFEHAFTAARRPTVRFAYLTVADKIAESLSTASPAPTGTGMWLGDRPGSLPVEPPADRATTDAVALVDQLVDWLGATYEQVANMAGVSRSALFYWRRPGAVPRSGSMHQLMRVHAVASLLVKRFGVDGARRWLHSDA